MDKRTCKCGNQIIYQGRGRPPEICDECRHPSRERTCPCGNPAAHDKGLPRCEACQAESVRLAQQRYRDQTRDSYQRGWDEPTCIWRDCGKDINPRPYEVIRPKKFCSDQHRTLFQSEQRRAETLLRRRCRCGAAPTNKTGVPLCDPCREERKKERSRAHTLYPYGISVTDYDRILASQGGGCAICGTLTPGSGRSVFAVDHDHATGGNRGLLCYACNTAIGLLGDDPAMLRAAADYIEQHQAAA